MRRQGLTRIGASGPSLVPGAGQYLYVASVSDWSVNAIGRGGRDCITYAVDHRQDWTAVDGSGLERDATGPSTYTSLRDRAVCLSMHLHATTRGGTSNAWFAPDCLEIAPILGRRALSTDPRALLHEIQRVGRSWGPAQDFDVIESLVQETDASPALRAALYRAAALIPGVDVLGLVADHLGRRGLGLALSTDQERTELIFNPRTAALLAEQITSARPGVTGWAVYLSSRLVDDLPYRSPVALTPPCRPTGQGYGRDVPGGTVLTGRPSG